MKIVFRTTGWIETKFNQNAGTAHPLEQMRAPSNQIIVFTQLDIQITIVWETYCFCSVSYYYYYYSSFFPCTMNLSTSDLGNYRTEFHETWWSYRYMFLVDPKVFRFVVKGSKPYFWGLKGVGVTIESYGKLEISYINVDNF